MVSANILIENHNIKCLLTKMLYCLTKVRYKMNRMPSLMFEFQYTRPHKKSVIINQ